MILLSQSSQEAKELFSTAFDDMPTYPEHMERNNVLMKRITEIKSEKGFLANKAEEDNQASSPTLKTIMSAALSKGGE